SRIGASRSTTRIQGLNDPHIRERFDECKEKNERLKTEVDEMQEEVNRLKERIDQLEIELGNSPLKKKASKLQKINEQINIAHEEIREFDSSADEKLAKNNEKYRDLLVKEQEYDEFLKGFDQQKQTLTLELEEHSDEIVRILQKISANIGQTAAIEPSVTALDMDELLQGKGSLEELQELYVRLQDEMQSLDDKEIRLNSEMEKMERRMLEMAEQAESFGDVDRIAMEAEEKIRYKSQMKKLEMLKEENARRRAEIEEREKETNYEPLKAEV
ncbi:hypothetical protein ANCCEY_05639, partial [Ancylostoma ceylanicum]